MPKYTFAPLSEKEYATHIKKASYTTFYNSPERMRFIAHRNRKTGLYKISVNDSVVALAFYQVIPARSGSFVYFQHSPVFIDTRSAEDVTFWQELRSFAVEIGQKEQAVYVRFTPRIPSKKEIVTDIMTAGFKRAPVQELDACVTRTITVAQYAEANLREDHQKMLERARKRNLEPAFSIEVAALEDFVSIYRTLAAKKQIDYVPVDYLKEELKTYAESGQILIASLRDDKETLYAASAIIIQGHSAWNYWSAITDQGKELGADVLLLHETLEELKKRKTTVLDLWGGSVSKEVAEKGLPHPWKSMDQFKQGFGAVLSEYVPTLDLPVKAPQYLAAVFYQRALMLKRGYPYLPLSGV
ncbi:MAG: peptidoglycan bridge formation glycyltransferase FemA/FemB family protein [Patescibacteria group bacterium]|jgi:lipid II:glycine glycyltransferase (peptidoglycan interpeptide bridge formation enzyme)